jgi:hypothetical protein
MSRSKENISSSIRTNFIRYLYQEGQRQGIHKAPNFYSELIKFIDTPEGQEAFDKFNQIHPRRLGITVSAASSFLFKRAF